MLCRRRIERGLRVKSFADTSFFLLFDEVVRRGNPNRDSDVWTADGVTWTHTRHAFEGQSYGFTVEIFEGTRAGKDGWRLMVAKEHWWAGRRGDAVRSAHWAKPMKGSRQAILAWFKQRQREMDARG